MERKLRKIGNSTGLLIPKVMLESMDLFDGDTVEISYNPIKKEITIRNKQKTPTSDESEIEAIVVAVVKVLKDQGML